MNQYCPACADFTSHTKTLAHYKEKPVIVVECEKCHRAIVLDLVEAKAVFDEPQKTSHLSPYCGI